MKDTVTNLIAYYLVERPANQQTFNELITSLEAGGHEIGQRFDKASDTPANREWVRHIIGLERWGQRRLRVGLGETPTLDESTEYYPPSDLAWSELTAAFAHTRNETVAIARKLSDETSATLKVRHNEFGPISIRGWIKYLIRHADLESRRIR